MNKKARRVALQGLITLKAQQQELMGITGLSFSEPKTKLAIDVLKNLGLTNKKVVVVLDKNDEQLKKSFRNIEGVKYLLVNYLNPFDIMHADKLLFTENSLQELQK